MEESLKSPNVDPHSYTILVFIGKILDWNPTAAADPKPTELPLAVQMLCEKVDFSMVLTEFILIADIQTFHNLKFWKQMYFCFCFF